MKKLILDTSAWFAFLFEKDQFHDQAVEVVEKGVKLVLLFTVYEEILALIHHRLGKEKAIKAGQLLKRLWEVEWVYVNRVEEKQIWEKYKNSSKQIDSVNASVAWLAKRLDLSVFTFDEHFKKMGVRVIPE